MNTDKKLACKTIVVTGATSGIGLATTEQLVEQGAYVIGIGRNLKKCEEVEKILRKSHPKAKVDFLIADLSSLKQVKKLAKVIRQKVSENERGFIDVLINNAGTVSSWYVSTTEGFELQFAVNHLAPFLLTHELMQFIKAAPMGRIITVSSGSHYNTKIRWKDILMRKHYNCLMAYKQSKLANVIFSTELNRRLGTNSKVKAYAVDPGLVNTDIGLKGLTGFARWIWKKRSIRGIKPEEAAESIVYIASEPSIQNSQAVYWKECKACKPSGYSQREDVALKLWELSESMCGIKSAEYGLGIHKGALNKI